MTDQFARLFDCWCLPHEYLHLPEYMEGNPMKAYGIYAFEEGFKLALNLAAPLLTQNDYDPTR